MKFNNIKVGMLIQHKMTGMIIEIKEISNFDGSYAVDCRYHDNDGNSRLFIYDDEDASLFRKYKGMIENEI